MRVFHTGALRLLVLLGCCIATGAAQADEPESARLLVADEAGAPLAHAVVWWGAAPESRAGVTDDTVVITQIDKQFVPEIAVARIGQRVEFPNHDSVSHHVYSFARPNAFEFELYESGQSPVMRFEHPGVVTLGCNIHDLMLGYVVVVDAAHYAVTDDEGYATFAVAPAPADDIFVWSPRLGGEEPVQADRDDSGGLIVRNWLQPKPRPAGGSLAWEDY